MMRTDGRIFVSYRRGDSLDVTGRIFDRLANEYGRERLFRDLDSMMLGADFPARIRKAVAQCDAVLAIIGPHWDPADTTTGVSRLQSESDFVRIELQTALERRIPVIPILVGGAAIPQAERLPAPLRKIVDHHGMHVRSDPDFHRDVDRLIADLTRTLDKAAGRRARRVARRERRLRRETEPTRDDVPTIPPGPREPVPVALVEHTPRMPAVEYPAAAPDSLGLLTSSGHTEPRFVEEFTGAAERAPRPRAERIELGPIPAPYEHRPASTYRSVAAILAITLLVILAARWWSDDAPPDPPMGWETTSYGVHLGMSRDAVQEMLGRPSKVYDKNVVHGRVIDAYKLTSAHESGPTASLSLIYAYVQPSAGGDYVDSALQVEMTVPDWPGTDFVRDRLDAMQGPEGRRIVDQLHAKELEQLQQRAVACVNLSNASHAARLLWKPDAASSATYLYIGVWAKTLHAQDDTCR